MAVRGTVKNGKVVLNDPKALPEGIEVEVRPARKVKALAKPSPKPSKTATRSLADRLAKVVGTATGLPPDASVNHDHYLYGVPKRD